MFVFIIFLVQVQLAKAISFCNGSEESEVCYLGKRFVSSDYPSGSHPVLINTTLKINEILEINAEKHTISLLLDMFVIWTDERIWINQSQADIQK